VLDVLIELTVIVAEAPIPPMLVMVCGQSTIHPEERLFLAIVKFVRDRSNKTTPKYALPLFQLISCLQDTGCNPFRLDGEIMDEDRFEVECEGNKRALGELCACQIMQAFFFQNWSRVVEVFEVLTSKHR